MRNGSAFCTLVEHVDKNDGTKTGLVHRSFLLSLQVYKDVVDAPLELTLTHSEKFTLPSLSVSYKLQPSSVFAPLTLISSKLKDTFSDVGRPVSSTHNRVRSFWPGSSFAPAVSLTQVRPAACATESAENGIPVMEKNTIITTAMIPTIAVEVLAFKFTISALVLNLENEIISKRVN